MAVADNKIRRHIKGMMGTATGVVVFASTSGAARDTLRHNAIMTLVADPPILATLPLPGASDRPRRVVAVVDGARPPTLPLPAAVSLVRLNDANASQRFFRAIGTPVPRSAGQFPGFGPLVGVSPVMRCVFEQIRRVAASDSTVLIQGESGTGKALAAQAVHDFSPRRRLPFMVLSCATIPSGLMESTLFGHRRGAFTGASGDRPGFLETARGGTVFLDDIDAMDSVLQAKLLRILEDKRFEPLGSHRVIQADVRFVAATNRNLAQLVRAGAMREDLYYRLQVLPVEMPPLRKRIEDIALLADYFVAQLTRASGCPVRPLTPSGRHLLASHHWPGNVRELRNLVERLLTFTDAPVIDAAAVQSQLGSTWSELPPQNWQAATRLFQRQLIDQALKHAGGNRTRAAALLGIHRNTLTAHLNGKQPFPAASANGFNSGQLTSPPRFNIVAPSTGNRR